METSKRLAQIEAGSLTTEKLATVREMAQIAALTEKALRRMMEKGKVPADLILRTVSGEIRFEPRRFLEWFLNRRPQDVL